MEFLKAQAARIQQQLGGLTASQRMLAGSLVVIMVMTLFWWGRYASTADMEPLLGDTPLKAEELSRITQSLRAKGIDFKTSTDGKVMVSADRRAEVMAQLAWDEVLPSDTSNAIEEALKKGNWFDSPTVTKERMNVAKGAYLASIIKGFPNVGSAAVVIDNTRQRALGDSVEPSASINIRMRSGHKADKKLVEAAGNLVAGAVASLSLGRIRVTADGATFRLAGDGIGGGGAGDSEGILEMERAAGRQKATTVLDHFRFIEGLMVSVSCKINMVSRTEKTRNVDPKTLVYKPKSEEEKKEETTSGARAGADPGINANLPGDINGGGGGGGQSSTVIESTKTEHALDYKQQYIEEVSPAGAASIVSAAVMFPRSHFVQVYKQKSGTDKEPEDAVLQPVIDEQIRNYKPQVAKCLGLATEGELSVTVYPDVVPAGLAAAPVSAGSAVTVALGGHAKEIALGVLALASLFMMAMMVKKGTPAAVAAPLPPPPARGPTVLAVGDDSIGEATDSAMTLDGMELDDDAIRTQQMLDQVSSMVKDNPDAAAHLVKRWMNRT